MGLQHADESNFCMNSLNVFCHTFIGISTSFLLLPDSFGCNFATTKVLFLSHFQIHYTFRRISLYFCKYRTAINIYSKPYPFFSFYYVNFIEIIIILNYMKILYFNSILPLGNYLNAG